VLSVRHCVHVTDLYIGHAASAAHVFGVQPPGAKGKRVNIPDPVCGNVPVKRDDAVTQTNSETTAGVPGRVLFSL
jgi:hypothetical protein